MSKQPLASQPAEQPAIPPAAPGARLSIDVQWADISRADGQAFVVGHYIDVLPQNAELVLDRALSRATPASTPTPKPTEDADLVLTDLTRRRAIRGALGDVTFFPWKDRGQVVLAGMGRLGTFREPQLRTLAGSVARTVGRLLDGATICTVLIGSGFGNLDVPAAVRGLLSGVAEALSENPSLNLGVLRIVEYRLDRAYEILDTVQAIAPRIERDCDIPIKVHGSVIDREEAGGVIPIPFGFSLMLASLAQACHAGSGSPLNGSLETLINELPERLRTGVKESLRRLGDEPDRRRLGLAFKLGTDEGKANDTIPDRVSFSHDGKSVRSAAITNLTTVSARDLDIGLGWVDRIARDLHKPPLQAIRDEGLKAFRRLVHPELRERLQSQNPLVLELDRTMAHVPWELIHPDADGAPLGVLRPVARQLRTAYSPRPPDGILRRQWKALVIGNPDGTLPAAAAEAQEVAKLLEKHQINVHLRIGPPDELGLGSVPDVLPADLYDIVGLLQSGEYDLVHYAGHAHFSPDHPDRSGWLFQEEVLTPSKLEGVERAPRLIVANACVSAGVSTTTTGRMMTPAAAMAGAAAGQATPAHIRGDSRLVASLADEFFRRGVADYIGTAWEVPEAPAKLFAETLYKRLLPRTPSRDPQVFGGIMLGLAVQEARRTLYDRSFEFGEHASVWAAYQHYGDPTRTLAE